MQVQVWKRLILHENHSQGSAIEHTSVKDTIANSVSAERISLKNTVKMVQKLSVIIRCYCKLKKYFICLLDDMADSVCNRLGMDKRTDTSNAPAVYQGKQFMETLRF